MNRVLVTGATGFAGHPVLRRLGALKDTEVYSVSRKPSSGLHPHVRWLKADLLVPGAPANVVAQVQPTHLLHLAWEATPGSYLESQANLGWLAASVELLDAFVAGAGRRFVGVGTCLEYDVNTDGLSKEDLTPLRPQTLYGATKHAFSVAALQAGATLGVSVAWVRLFHLYGPHEHPDRLVAHVVRALLEGREAELSSGNQVRDYLSVVEAADAIVAVLLSEAQGPVNVGSGMPVAVRDVAQTVARICGAEHLLRFGSRDAADATVSLLAPDVTKLAEKVGWRSELSLEDGLRHTVAWWQERLQA